MHASSSQTIFLSKKKKNVLQEVEFMWSESGTVCSAEWTSYIMQDLAIFRKLPGEEFAQAMG